MYPPIGDVAIDRLAKGLASEKAAKLERSLRPTQSASDHLILDQFPTTKLVISIRSRMSAHSRRNKPLVSLRKGESPSLDDPRSLLSYIQKSL
jgi:hypothetical protein